MTAPVRIYHNPRCSKSRSACTILAEKGVEAEVIEYLKTPPDRATLSALLAKLGLRAEELVRKGEAIVKTEYAGRTMSDEDWLEAMLAHPILIERPIVVVGERAVVARPPERVLELL
ncbi:arsenate reductase (glutaredoxin) [Thauera sp. CAU 1555]|uniref:Arsenate reductase n=1 Tax=Thauera sedimentorum TaxID=2767595 RepID=A0ABR9BBU8_9RHOO|nr:arsenate reductase (glutaredoxin) [Thauera sedimentorum]MBC9071782.1 arsenate reductase (glutaredoxin) [Thauera sedimentorum]MBD8502701.1 arsenate reductase (glutaredoxin) [Thauera sedimentorum]